MRVASVTEDRWTDLEDLFGPRGAYGGCWCMYFRLTSAQFSEACRNGGESNRAALHKIVRAGSAPGLLAYDGEAVPVGWCALAPRVEYGRVLRSRSTKPAEPAEPNVWAVTCFFIRRGRRGQGVASELLTAAIEYARSHGAGVLEGYPIDTRGGRRQNAELYYGTTAMFQAAGFTEVERRTAIRPIMRLNLVG